MHRSSKPENTVSRIGFIKRRQPAGRRMILTLHHAPACDVCQRPATVAVTGGYFLCNRCEEIMNHEFPDHRFTISRIGPIAAVGTSIPFEYPEMPSFLRRADWKAA
jgi:hypothetical protein